MTSIYPDQEVRNALEKQGDTETAFGDKSPGVRRIEAITMSFKSWHLWVLYISVFLTAYCYGLDGTVRYNYQVGAVAAFSASAQISTIAVVRSIVAAAAQPVFAKISDYFGRISILAISVVFYILGTIVQASAKNLAAFSGGAVLYQFGYTGTQLLVEVIIADTTSLRSRLFFSYIPATPFIINAWVSGDIAVAVLGRTTWRWGIGMWAIIFPICTLPLFFSLIHGEVRAKKAGLLRDIPSPLASLAKPGIWSDIFWQMDLMGLLLLAGSLTLMLLPFTLAGGTTNLWKTGRVIAPLVVGFVVAFPLFLLWELKFARHPVVPFRILKDRQIIFGLTIALLLNTAWYCQGDYLYYTLIVAFGKPLTVVNRVIYIYSFVSVVVGVILGLVVRHVRRLKWFVVAGTCLFVLAFGLLIRYRGGHSTTDFAGLVAAEVILGIAGGLFPYPTQALVQSAVQHERTAVITSLYLASYSVGSALGNTIAAGIWTNKLPGHLITNLANAGINNATLAAGVYADPFTFIAANPIGTPARDAVDLAYRQVQRYLTIAGICISSLLVFVSLGLRNPYLGDKQSLEDAEGFDVPELAKHSEKVLRNEGSHGSHDDDFADTAAGKQSRPVVA